MIKIKGAAFLMICVVYKITINPEAFALRGCFKDYYPSNGLCQFIIPGSHETGCKKSDSQLLCKIMRELCFALLGVSYHSTHQLDVSLASSLASSLVSNHSTHQLDVSLASELCCEFWGSGIED